MISTDNLTSNLNPSIKELNMLKTGNTPISFIKNKKKQIRKQVNMKRNVINISIAILMCNGNLL